MAPGSLFLPQQISRMRLPAMRSTLKIRCCSSLIRELLGLFRPRWRARGLRRPLVEKIDGVTVDTPLHEPADRCRKLRVLARKVSEIYQVVRAEDTGLSSTRNGPEKIEREGLHAKRRVGKSRAKAALLRRKRGHIGKSCQHRQVFIGAAGIDGEPDLLVTPAARSDDRFPQRPQLDTRRAAHGDAIIGDLKPRVRADRRVGVNQPHMVRKSADVPLDQSHFLILAAKIVLELTAPKVGGMHLHEPLDVRIQTGRLYSFDEPVGVAREQVLAEKEKSVIKNMAEDHRDFSSVRYAEKLLGLSWRHDPRVGLISFGQRPAIAITIQKILLKLLLDSGRIGVFTDTRPTKRVDRGVVGPIAFVSEVLDDNRIVANGASKTNHVQLENEGAVVKRAVLLHKHFREEQHLNIFCFVESLCDLECLVEVVQPRPHLRANLGVRDVNDSGRTLSAIR